MLSLLRIRNSFSHAERVWLGGGRSRREARRCGMRGCGRGWIGMLVLVGVVGGEGVVTVTACGGGRCGWEYKPSRTLCSAHPRT